MTYLESKKSLCRKLNIDYDTVMAGSDNLFSMDDLNDYINLAALEVWDYARWIFTEKAYTVTGGTVASQEYYDYPDDFQSDSIFLLRVEDENGDIKTYKKIRYTDYMQYRENYDEGEEKLWADHNRSYFINPNAWDNIAGRDIEVWGRIVMTTMTDSTTPMPFSPNTDNDENSGNHAIVKLAYSFALNSEKKNQAQQGIIVRQEAYQMIEILAKREREDQADYEVYDTPQFKYKKLF